MGVNGQGEKDKMSKQKNILYLLSVPNKTDHLP